MDIKHLVEKLHNHLNRERTNIRKVNLKDERRAITTLAGSEKRVTTFMKDLKKTCSGIRDMEVAALCTNEQDFIQVLQEYAKTHNLLVTEEGEAPIISPEELEKLEKLTLCKNIEFTTSTKEIDMFLMTEDQYISTTPAHHYISSMEVRNPLMEAIPLLPIYRPDIAAGIYEMETPTGETVDCINSYVPPRWKNYEGDLPDCLPKEVEILFNQVVGDMDRKYFLHFLNRMIEARNTSYLILQGKGGVGKGTMKSVFKALVGQRNYSDGKKSTLTGSFNSALQDVTLSVFDEFKFTMEEENVLKEIPNGTISIEKKFKNSTQSTRIFLSMILMNNKPRDNYLSFDGRKFAPVELSEERLEEKIPADEIAKMVAKVDYEDSEEFDISYVAQIGRYIQKHGFRPDLFPQGEYRGPRFWKLCHTSMSAWQKAVVVALNDLRTYFGQNIGLDFQDKLDEGRLKFSELQNQVIKKQGKDLQKINFPGDYSSGKDFLSIFRDLNGGKVYEPVDANDPVLGDFYITKVKRENAEDEL